MKGVFVSFEGLDASGKTTQIGLLKEALEKEKIEPVITREPGGTRISERIREILLDPAGTDMTARTEMLLYAASRAQHVDQVIRPALKEGRVVISDRFTDSSIAYQGYGRELGGIVGDVNRIATGGLQPDLTFLLITTPDNMRRRISPGREDRLEAEKDEFHRKVLEGFLEIRKQDPGRILLIDGTQSIETISEMICGKTMELIRRSHEGE